MTKEEKPREKVETPQESAHLTGEQEAENPFSREEEEKIKKRLQDLGYIE